LPSRPSPAPHRRADARLGGAERDRLDLGDLCGGPPEVRREEESAALPVRERREHSPQLVALVQARVLVAGIAELELRLEELGVERLGLPEPQAVDGHVPPRARRGALRRSCPRLVLPPRMRPGIASS
jgi:hypothetical protein